MCSVLGCYSNHGPRFKLPEDPDRRLEWVRFLARVNEQCFKESSWRDISICCDHFERDCFENPSHSPATLKPDAVPSLCLNSDEPEPNDMEINELSVETTGEFQQSGSCNSQSEGACGSPVPSDGTTLAVSPVHQKHMQFDLITKKAALVKTQGKFVVNDKCLLQLFSSKCPLCGSNIKIERFTKGTLVIVNQRCLQCEYINKWGSRASLDGPAIEDQYLTVDISPQLQQAAASKDTSTGVAEGPQTVAATGEGAHTDKSEKLREKFDISENCWSLDDEILEAGSLHESEGDENDSPLSDPARRQLCTDCGVFYSQQRPHVCLHKLKPHSCNFCGRRFVDLMSLNSHNRMHNMNYEHRHVLIKTQLDRPRLKQTHVTKERLYQCPDCFETFASRIECSVHVFSHKGVPKFKCNTCGMQFSFKNSLKVHSIVHTGERPYACLVCQRRFSLAGNLKTHMRLHTGERPYKCEHCEQCFNQNISLKLHIQRYHTGGSGRGQRKNNIETDALGKKSRKAKDSVQKGKRGNSRTVRSKGSSRPKKNAAE